MDMSFNFYYDLQFWIAFAVVCIILRAISSYRKYRNVLLLMSSVLMLLALPAFGIQSLVFVCSTAVLTWLMGSLLSKENYIVTRRGRILFSCFAVTLLVSTLIFFKYSVVQEELFSIIGNQKYGAAKAIFVIGISYFLAAWGWAL